MPAYIALTAARWRSSRAQLVGVLVVATLGLLAPFAAQAQQGQPRRGPPQQQQQQQGPRIDYERVLYNQPRLIDEALASIRPSDSSEPSTYFIGFSGWSQQDVFIREVAQARDIVDERLGTLYRSLLLVNHTMALDEVPLATVTNLDIVLGRLGKLMSRDKDTLILFLTSHGVENLFAVQFPPLPLNHLTPSRLRGMLDRAGIKNRIIIISACHSGSFVPALRDPSTLVMTAARTDRASFGCDHKNDWTFFGNALFNHGLRKTASLTDAFEAAKVIITGWESAEKFKPSEPQIFVGDGIGPVVDRLARRTGAKTVGQARD